MDPNTLLYLVIGVAIVAMIVFQFRSSRKRRREQDEMREKLVPGAEVMTSHGIYGQVVSIDEEKNEAIIETTPGTRLRLHRQTLTRVVEPLAETVDPEDEAANVELDSDERDASARLEAEDAHAAVAEPEYGERLGGTAAPAEASDEPLLDGKPKRTPRQPPTA